MSKKKVILHIAANKSLDGGGNVSHLELIKNTKKYGYTPHVILPSEGAFSKALTNLNIDYTIIPYYWWIPYQEYETPLVAHKNIEAVTKLINTINKLNPAGVVSNSLNIPWGALASAITNTPHIWIAREFPVEEFSYLRTKYDFINQFSNVVIGNSKNLADYMNKKTSVNNAKYFYSYVDVSKLKLGKKISEEPRIVTIGSFQDRKNQLEIVEAAKLLKQKGLTPQVVLIGGSDNEYSNLVISKIDEYELGETVKIIPKNSDPWKFVNKSDIFVHPSKSESIGRTTTEAMKLGVLCIGADIPGIKEAIEICDGVLYKHGSALSLAEKIEHCLNNRAFSEKTAKRAQKLALDKLSEQNCNKLFYDAVDTVINDDNPMSSMSSLNLFFAKATIDTQLIEANQKIKLLRKEIGALNNSRAMRFTRMARRVIRKLNPKNLIKKNVYFVYTNEHKSNGSTILRGKQLSEIAQKYTGYNVEYIEFKEAKKVKDSILFLTKYVLTLPVDDIMTLKHNRNLLILDPVDANIPESIGNIANSIVAANTGSVEKLRKDFPTIPIKLVDHHVDFRIQKLEHNVSKKLQIGYFGELYNTVVTSKIEGLVDFFDVSTSSQESEWIKQIANYNLHYAVRRKDAKNPNKPFTKGFIAATLGANIIIQDDQTEAVDWLGKDYPYLIKGSVTEEKIIRMIQHAKKSYGTKEWDRGLKAMKNIRKRISDKAIGKQLKAALRSAN